MQLGSIEIQQSTGGRWVRAPRADLSISGVSTDSRTLQAGEGFVALRGENFDGHAFLEQAVEQGASVLIVNNDESEDALMWGVPVLAVQDTLRALGDLAIAWRRKCRAQRISIVGSSGKTTTKDMLACILSENDATHATRGNLNNLIGVPQTLFSLNQSDRYAVIELGMNEAGELRRLTEIVRPDLLLLLNVGDAHVGQFGSIEALRRAKAESVEALGQDAAIVYDIDSEGTREIMERFGGGRASISFGIDRAADFMAGDIRPHHAGGYAFSLIMGRDKIAARLPLFGRHNVCNALAAAAAARALGISNEMIVRGLQKVRPAAMRSELRRVGEWDCILDCYNANPSSMRAALGAVGEWFESREGKGKLYLVLGEMLELGEAGREAHVALGRNAADIGPEAVFLVGDGTRATLESLEGQDCEAMWFDSTTALAESLVERLFPGDVVFLKGSRGNRLEEVVAFLEKAASAAENSKDRIRNQV